MNISVNSHSLAVKKGKISLQEEELYQTLERMIKNGAMLKKEHDEWRCRCDSVFARASIVMRKLNEEFISRHPKFSTAEKYYRLTMAMGYFEFEELFFEKMLKGDALFHSMNQYRRKHNVYFSFDPNQCGTRAIQHSLLMKRLFAN